MYLNEVHRSLLYDKICNLIETSCNELRMVCHAAILTFATLYPREISALIRERLPLITGKLIELNFTISCNLEYVTINMFNVSDEEPIELRVRKLEAVAAAAKTYECGIEVLPRLISQAYAVNFEISFTALACLHRLVATNTADYDVQHYLYSKCNIIEKLTTFRVSPVDQRLDPILNISRLIVRNLTSGEQKEIVNKYAAILSGEVSEIDAVLIMNIFIPLRQHVNITISPMLLENLYNLALNSTHSNIRLITCKFIAIVLNKMNDNDECSKRLLLYFKEKITDNLQPDIDIGVQQATASLQIWLTKAVITKGSCDVGLFLDEVCNNC